MGSIPEITPEQLAAELLGPPRSRPALLDVRGHDERAVAALPGALHIPLHELEERADELEDLRGRPVVVYCHRGVRSLSGAAILRDRGFDARSLAGGIDLWAARIDPALPRY